MIYHLCHRTHFLDQFQNSNSYTADSLKTEGFIHCSEFSQVKRTLGTFFDGVKDLVLLHLNTNALEKEKLIFEDLIGEGQLFPHYYDSIPFSAVERIQPVPNSKEEREAMGFWHSSLTLLKPATKLISQLSKIPSYSSYEHRIHPYLEKFCSQEKLDIQRIKNNNLFISKDKKSNKTLVFSAHLDKINHLAKKGVFPLNSTMKEGKMIGLLDDSVGLGIGLITLLNTPAYVAVAFSEMEESTDLKQRPEIMKNKGKGLEHGIGANRISKWMLKKGISPELMVTLDVTPKFGNEEGVAIYSKHWEFNKTNPDQEYRSATAKWVGVALKFDNRAIEHNNTNDYLTYGEFLQPKTVSIAIEPAVHHYHSPNEEVHISDIQRVLRLSLLLSDYSSSCSSE